MGDFSIEKHNAMSTFLSCTKQHDCFMWSFLSAMSRLESLHNCWMLLRNIPNLTLPSLQEEGKKNNPPMYLLEVILDYTVFILKE